MSYFDNKIIWITGASSGIGKALAIELSQTNAILILSSRNKVQLEEVRTACANIKLVHVYPLDLAQVDSLEGIANAVESVVGPVDILINNGGLSQRSLAIDTNISVDIKLMDVNYLGTVALTKSVLPSMMKRKQGQIAVISSTTGKIGVPMRSGYCGAKHALHGFFEALRAELHDTNIGITMICPGFINTNISKNALLGDGSSQNTMDDAQANGMPVKVFSQKALKAIQEHRKEVAIGGFKDTTLVIYAWRFFPDLLRRIIVKAKVL
ncbi:MAG: SDR family oxidoreductase [Granulosicoccus sp.]